MLAGSAPAHGAYYQAPGYGYFLAAIHGLGGGVVVVKLAQLALGVLNSVLVWRLARKCFDAREAIVAGALWAIYPMALFHEVLVLKPTLAVSLSLLALVVMQAPFAAGMSVQNRGRNSYRRCAASGFLLGLASLVQAEIAGVALLLWVLAVAPWRREPPGVPGRRSAANAKPIARATSWIASGVGAASFLLVLAIPTIQNIARGRGFVVVAYGGGTNFYIGNHSNADGSYVGLRSFRSDPTFEEADAVELSTAVLGREPRPVEVSRYWWMRGLAWWREQPWAAFRLTVKKLALLWGPQEQADVIDTGIASRWMGILRNPIVHPRVLLPIALVGLWLTRRRRELWVVRTFVLGSTLMIVPFFVFERFRMPMTAACMPFIAHASIRFWDALRARRIALAAGGLTAAAALAVPLSFAHVQRERAVMRANIGNMYLIQGRYEEALVEFEAVRAARPAAWRVEINMAMAEAKLGRSDAALRTLGSVIAKLRAEERSTGRTPREELVTCYELAGDLELGAARPRQAAENYQKALAFAPAYPTLASKLAQAAAADSLSGNDTIPTPLGER